MYGFLKSPPRPRLDLSGCKSLGRLPTHFAAGMIGRLIEDDCPMDEETFAFGSFRLIPAQRMLFEDGKPLRLGSRERAVPITREDALDLALSVTLAGVPLPHCRVTAAELSLSAWRIIAHSSCRCRSRSFASFCAAICSGVSATGSGR
jgi:hypothetical protein